MEKGQVFGKGAVQKVLSNESYLQKRVPQYNVKKTLLVPVTSDKGLCGSINTIIIREVKKMVKANREGIKLLVIGEKGTTGLIRPCPDVLVQSISAI